MQKLWWEPQGRRHCPETWPWPFTPVTPDTRYLIHGVLRVPDPHPWGPLFLPWKILAPSSFYKTSPSLAVQWFNSVPLFLSLSFISLCGPGWPGTRSHPGAGMTGSATMPGSPFPLHVMLLPRVSG